MSGTTIRLGLIGDNIAASQSPRLHELAGRLCGLDVSYERVVPPQRGEDFETTFQWCRDQGFTGLNITYPYKERVVPLLQVPDAAIKAVGACNTVVFKTNPPSGSNTDFTGFVGAFQQSFGTDTKPGVVAMVGAGGVGKAVGFGLAQLGCSHLRLFDRDTAKAEGLAKALLAGAATMRVDVASTVEEATSGADGLVNCTPLGMEGYPGSSVPEPLMLGKKWAFDAVYTPVNTQFLQGCTKAGLAILSGYELFFHQGVDAFRIFTGQDVDQTRLRQELSNP
ncbi:shikimate dehydrogenase family protein [Rhizobium oryziradicis]|uniref:Shikimate dehydrogenase n=1 Tax=Rhizobium oryziradicis TaxID=1867956 RepID=A0A1Q8ZKW4_9HYPH|nr:shikimate dehydrogenase [Rhizobium oryziradicis]OLP42534.1 shikimate dehydrogenase [Rhizobium oryziradicis]